MGKLALLIAAVGVWTGVAPASSAPAPEPITYVQAGRLLADPGTGRVETRKTLVIRGGRVVEIRDGYTSASGGTVVDLHDSFVLPGLIDSHVHILDEIGPSDVLEQVTKTSADWAIDGAYFAARTLAAGFTTVADLGDDSDGILALRDGINAGRIPGPRILAAGFVGSHGGHGDVFGYRPDVMNLLSSPWLCDGADDCRRAVRMAVRRGVDLIKIASTGGVMSDTTSGVGQQMTDEELVAIVQTAHSLGRRVTCHAHGVDGINAALRAGVDSIEHGAYLDEESIRLFKQHDAYLVPTLLGGDTITREAQRPDTWLPPVIREKALQVGPLMIAMADRARKGGVKFAFGTDSEVSPHGQNAREFALLVKAGFTPLDAIRTATVWGADHNRLSDQIGSLAPGKMADIIAVKGDPLKDVTELERVTFVMKSGRVFRP